MTYDYVDSIQNYVIFTICQYSILCHFNICLLIYCASEYLLRTISSALIYYLVGHCSTLSIVHIVRICC